MTLAAVDVSEFQQRTPPLDGIAAILVRASHGTTPDPMFGTHVRNARAAGVVVGAYHFLEVGAPAAAQRDTFLAAVDGATRWLAVDLEPYTDSQGARVVPTRTQARAFITAVKDTGRGCGLYHSASGWPGDLGQSWAWVADWDREPTIPWDVWQERLQVVDHGVDNDRVAHTLQWLYDQEGRHRMDLTPYTPALICDVAPGGTVYTDAERTAVLATDWPGAQGVALWMLPTATATSKPYPLAPIDYGGKVYWVGVDLISKVRPAAQYAPPMPTYPTADQISATVLDDLARRLIK